MANTRALSDADEAQVVKRYRDGASPAALAVEYGVGRRTIYNAIKRAGVAPQRPTHFTSTDEEEVIVARYKNGESADTIAADVDVDRVTVYNVLRRRGVRTRLTMTSLDEAQQKAFVAACVDGEKVPAAAKRFGIGTTYANLILRAHDVSLPKGRPRSCEVNDVAFDEITPESAYWMGFLFADGCVHRNEDGQASLVCGLGVKDLAHLEKLRTFCGSTHKIRHHKAKAGNSGGVPVPERTIVYLRVRSNRICDALARRGLVTKRTRAPVPELVTSQDFWRGCVDGDGSIGTCMSHDNIYAHFRLYGQKVILESFQNFLTLNQIPPTQLAPTQSGIWAIQTTGSKAGAIIELLYKDATIALDRKLERAKAIISGNLNQFPSY